VVDTVGPQVTKVFFNHLNGQIDVTFSNAVSGLNSSTLADAANYSFRKVHVEKQHGLLYRVNVISVTPAGNGTVENVILTINGGQPIHGGFYTFVIRSARPDLVSGVQDVAGNALDGEFYGFFPSGNHVPGGNFVARLDAVHNWILPPKSVIGMATPVFPPGTKEGVTIVTKGSGAARHHRRIIAGAARHLARHISHEPSIRARAHDIALHDVVSSRTGVSRSSLAHT
jgi:hypothetical protein